nr:MAG TPA: hypothetical protein [Caudoviricetes sp.]
MLLRARFLIPLLSHTSLAPACDTEHTLSS